MVLYLGGTCIFRFQLLSIPLIANTWRISGTKFHPKVNFNTAARNEVKQMENKLWNLKVKGTNLTAYNQCFQELILLFPEMVPNPDWLLERYIEGLPLNIKGNVTSSKPVDLHKAIEMAQGLMYQVVQELGENSGDKQKWNGNHYNPNNTNNTSNLNPNKRPETARVFTAEQGSFLSNLPSLAENVTTVNPHRTACPTARLQLWKQGIRPKDCQTPPRPRKPKRTGIQGVTVKWDDHFVSGCEQTTDEELNHALMAFTVNNEVSMCSKLCLDSYNALQAKYDELQSEFGDQEAALIAHKQANQIFEKDEISKEDIDDSLYEYGKHGPQPKSPSSTVSNASSIVFSICPSNDSDGELGAVSDASSTHYSTCQSNDSDGELGTVSNQSVNDNPIPIPSVEQVTIATQKTQPQVPKPKQPVDPSCILWKCILHGPYKLSNVIILAHPATDDSPVVLERTIVETLLNISPENKVHYDSEKEAIHLLLTGIRDKIKSTVDACNTAHEIWIATERLQQGESLNIQDVKTNLFWEFGRFTSHDGESMESYYSRFHKMMNEMIRNNLEVATMQIKGKEIAKPITPPSKSASKDDSDPEQAQRDKDMQKNLALIAKETVGNQVVQQTRIQYFNCKEFGHFAKECRKPKRVKDYTYHKEKMLLCKQAEKEPLEKVQYDVKYNVFANERQHSVQPESINDTHVMENDDSNVISDSLNIYDNDNQADQNAKACDDERVVLANLISNLKLDIDENKKIQKQLKKANASLTQGLKECKSTLEDTNRTLGESNNTWDSYLIALQNKQIELEKELVDQAWEKHSHDKFRAPTAHDMNVLIITCLMPLALKTQNDSFKFVCELKQEMYANLKYVQSLEKEINELASDKANFSNIYDLLLQECVSKDVTCSYLHSLSDFDAYNELQCLYLHKVKECECLVEKLSKQTENVSKEVYNRLLRSFDKLKKHSISLELALHNVKNK
ncbi:retrovirus-related pol polyprotein from transposon TNT 1-94 [Tanacetum coccineum]